MLRYLENSQQNVEKITYLQSIHKYTLSVHTSLAKTQARMHILVSEFDKSIQ